MGTGERGGGASAPLHFRQISQVLLEEGEEGGQVVLVGVGVSQAVSLPGVNLGRHKCTTAEQVLTHKIMKFQEFQCFWCFPPKISIIFKNSVNGRAFS